MTFTEPGPYRILCIEDDPIVRESIVAFLKDEGYEVHTANDGEEGIKKFDSVKPHVVLSDIRMPKMDGLELLRLVKKRSPSTEVIIISGTGKDEDLVSCINNRAYRYFQKPANLLEVSAEIKSAIELSDLRQRDKLHKDYLEELVTERTKQLRISQDRFEALFNSLSIIYICDFKWNLIDANQAALDLLGYTLEELKEINFLDILHPSQPLEKIENTFDELYQTRQQKHPIEVKLITKDKRTIYVESKAAVTADSYEIIGICKDVTFQKLAEEKIQKAYDELEKRVEGRTAELAKINRELQEEIKVRKHIEEKLVQAKRLAEEANLTKSQFLANISHELRTPMHGIMSFSQFGIDKIDIADKQRQLHYFKQIHKSGERLLTLLNDLLDLSKLESGKMEYEIMERDMRMIVNPCITEFSLAASEKNVSLDVVDPEFGTRVECDETRLDQVIRNLLSNAVKFSHDGGSITITYEQTNISVGRRATDRDEVEALTVCVKDEGIGIPEEELDWIFDKFVQSSKTRTGAGGTGLGLAICAEIIKAHHGRIWAGNNPEGGATIAFTLPYKHPQLSDS